MNPALPACSRPVAIWLGILIFLVLLMVAVGGVTRLTESGLSITQWAPVAGILPPLDNAAWQENFDSYRQSPEYLQKNYDFTLAEYKGIFWLEYIHRLLGRASGLALLLPYIYFTLRCKLPAPLRLRLGLVVLAFGAQGLMGWVMVHSGLIENPFVSPVKLMLHLGLATLIFWALTQSFFELSNGAHTPRWLPQHGYSGALDLFLGLLVAQILLGALVAGHDAGLVYNSWPLMGENFLAPEWLALKPLYLNFLQNPVTIQALHRMNAILLVMGGLWLLVRVYKYGARAQRSNANIIIYLLAFQFALGVATLIYAVPVTLGALHQITAFILLFFALRLRYHA